MGEDAQDLARRLHAAGLAETIAITLRNGRLEAGRNDCRVVIAEPAELTREQCDALLGAVSTEQIGLVVVGPRKQRPENLPRSGLVSCVADREDDEALALAIGGTLERVELRGVAQRSQKDISRYRYELGELVEIARAITQERDLEALLPLILEKSRFITAADAGSIYVLEGQADDPAQRTLRFKHSQNDSVAFESGEFSVPVSMRSIAGAAVLTREAIVIEDVYAMPEGTPYHFDPSFDHKVGYRSRSMIAIPMISATREVIGVIQLINKKRTPQLRLTSPALVEEQVVPFDPRSVELLRTLASQAGIALENALLYEEIHGIFQGFVRASVQAIEQRDPTTSGHSLRVGLLACRLAEMVDRAPDGKYRDVRFSPRDLKELEYASLLHDFGKIGVREEVLVKAKKLYPHELEAIRQRIAYAQMHGELSIARRHLEREMYQPESLEREIAEARALLEDAEQLIMEANEPTVLQEGDFSRLEAISRITYVGPEGEPRPLLSPVELQALQVRRGSLSSPEIDEIRSHVVHTRNFLSRIPWGRTLKNIPQIAGAHHEKLDGSGYPLGLLDEQIPLASKIMSVADIYDALTARDRPYKRAIPHERAVEILGFEVKDNHICAELVRIFREARVHRVLAGLAGEEASRVSHESLEPPA